MSDIIDLVIGYFTLKKLKDRGYINEKEIGLSFSEFIIRSVKAIKEIDSKEVRHEEK
ncbi:MAG: hypothetical protein ACLTXO_04145 [Fusobacterium varium]|uniref:hypothetical protein n=1 Tax=Fusobacterium varium TaxID=856 RepID=UPI0039950AB5